MPHKGKSPFIFPLWTSGVVCFFSFFFCLVVTCNLIRTVFFQDTHNQAGIAYNGGLVPLLKLLDSKNGSLQHNAAFALYGVADNEVT